MRSAAVVCRGVGSIDIRVCTDIGRCVRYPRTHRGISNVFDDASVKRCIPHDVERVGPMKERDVECEMLVIGTGASGMAVAVTVASQGLKVLVVEKEAGATAAPRRAQAAGCGSLAPGRRPSRAFTRSRVRPARTCSTKPPRTSMPPALTHSSRTVRRHPVSTRQTSVQVRHARSSRIIMPKRLAACRVDAGCCWSFHGRDPRRASSNSLPRCPKSASVFGTGPPWSARIWHSTRVFRPPGVLHIYVTKRLGRHMLDVLRHGRGMTLTNGNALAGRQQYGTERATGYNIAPGAITGFARCSLSLYWPGYASRRE